MRRLLGFGVVLVGLALATACDATGGATGSASSSPVPATSAASPPGGSASANPATANPTGALVEFDRQGGIAGLSDQLSVSADGGFTLVRQRPAARRSGRLTGTELTDLRRALEQSHFATLPGVESGSGSDLFTYHVTYAGQQIVAQDGAVAAPLRPVVDALSAIVQKYGS